MSRGASQMAIPTCIKCGGHAFELALFTPARDDCPRYDGGGGVPWASNTSGNPGAWLVVQGDGNLVVYSAGGSPLWSSNTCCH